MRRFAVIYATGTPTFPRYRSLLNMMIPSVGSEVAWPGQLLDDDAKTLHVIIGMNAKIKETFTYVVRRGGVHLY